MATEEDCNGGESPEKVFSRQVTIQDQTKTVKHKRHQQLLRQNTTFSLVSVDGTLKPPPIGNNKTASKSFWGKHLEAAKTCFFDFGKKAKM